MPKNIKSPSVFKPLEKILSMDFTQLRAMECEGGHCASEESIKMFVDSLLEFFNQFKETPPNKKQIADYKVYMEQITQEINKAERAYFLVKYTSLCPENSEQIASGNLLKSFKALPRRMQYWAAAAVWGEQLHNSQRHSAAIQCLHKWARFVDGTNSRCRQSFFPQRLDVTDETQYAGAAAATLATTLLTPEPVCAEERASLPLS